MNSDRLTEHELEDVFQRTTTPEWQIFARLFFALLFGAVLGFERESKNRPAGLRTHMLTALAAAVVAVTTMELNASAKAGGSSADPIRAIEAVTAGVAFLAAGTILQARGHVTGLTTGAGMWLAGTIGVACGFGYLSVAALATLFAMVVLSGLQRLSNYINPMVDPHATEIENNASAKAASTVDKSRSTEVSGKSAPKGRDG